MRGSTTTEAATQRESRGVGAPSRRHSTPAGGPRVLSGGDRRRPRRDSTRGRSPRRHPGGDLRWGGGPRGPGPPPLARGEAHARGALESCQATRAAGRLGPTRAPQAPPAQPVPQDLGERRPIQAARRGAQGGRARVIGPQLERTRLEPVCPVTPCALPRFVETRGPGDLTAARGPHDTGGRSLGEQLGLAPHPARAAPGRARAVATRPDAP